METHHAFSPLKMVLNSAVTEYGLIIQNKDVRPVGSLGSSALGNPPTNVEVKPEATGQGTCTYLSVPDIFCKFFFNSEKRNKS